jgi:K+-transporting ATPase ATPase B chain
MGKTVMVTGDNPLTAKFIAEAAGVDDFIAEAKPEDKITSKTNRKRKTV